jgi:CDP-glycerol glycerophosphotransferase
MLIEVLRVVDYLKRVAMLTLFLAPIELFCRLTGCLYGDRIWVFSERPDEARDNAYELYKYVKQNHPDIRAIYAIKKDSKDFRKISGVGEYVEHGSFRHYYFYSRCIAAVSTHIFGASPLGAAAKYISWLSPKRCVVYVQHGINKDHYSTFSKPRTRVDYMTCAVAAEYEYICKFGGYAKHEVGLVGLARFDRLIEAKADRTKILLMPTFRKDLFNLTRLDPATASTTFLRSRYYQSLQALLSDQSLDAVLRSKGIELYFFLHPSAQPFIELFHSDFESIVIASRKTHDLQDLISSASLLITDFSSVFFDFAFLSRPVIYYHFDYEDYRKSHYAEGYFDYETCGFGPVEKNVQGVVDALTEYTNSEMAQGPIYERRQKEFFLAKDIYNCFRIMNGILSHPKLSKQKRNL